MAYYLAVTVPMLWNTCNVSPLHSYCDGIYQPANEAQSSIVSDLPIIIMFKLNWKNKNLNIS